jgi:ATPase family AAA domain-containing protein 3A/B
VDPPSQKKGTSSSASVSGFDPTALERAAKAARELDRSSNAKDSLRLINTQEITKQKEHEAERAKYQAYQQELAIKRIAEEEVSAQRVLQKQTEQAKAQANYKDELDRKRMQEKMRSQRALADEERQKTEESLRRQEELKRKTLEYEAALRQQTEIARVKAEAEGRILQERQNHDLFLENRKLDALQYRETILESIKLGGSTLYGGLQDFIQDRQKLTNTAFTISGIALGIYSARMGTSIAGKYIEARLGKPSLVRETSKKNIIQMLRSPLSSFKLAFGSANVEGALKNVILESNLEQRLSRVSVSTANTKINRAPFRHLLLHGPPGTGKTMFAKGLAKECGLHYAIMTGGDVAPLGKDAVTEIHKLFDWANTTNKGVLLFIDEADAFLRKRSTERISEDMRNALNAFLYRTGEASHKFMIVYASNQPEQFDWAINDRIDEMVEFRLPSLEERLRMIVQYMDIYLLHPPAGSKQIIVDGVDEALLRSFAVATDGFSGREISKLAIAWQAAAYGTPNATIDKELLSDVLRDSLNSKQQKRSWSSPLDLERLTTDAPVVIGR